jgi:DNA-directed RNA polymerase specialized sigma24 family protein
MVTNAAPTLSLRVLQEMAARRAGSPEEAEDLVQDVLLAALEQDRALEDPGFPAWAYGVLRRRALFVARTAGRRRRREAEYAAQPSLAPREGQRLPREFIDSLPASLQVVALLANAGLGRAEIVSLLRISDTALRQRISGLRKAWKKAGIAPDPNDDGLRLSAGGPRRRALKAGLGNLPAARLAVADPDGHPIFLSDSAHIRPTRGN